MILASVEEAVQPSNERSEDSMEEPNLLMDFFNAIWLEEISPASLRTWCQ
jgi:hypothetical protein